ncbi:hypothetical protein HanRHA438_Chr12g0534841 [Helianthus annuus]|uniref:DUF4283 domain-containing protein n=1 Tax=Helianthus annuus TaxID=4232 RepID=A0A9K3HER3_HELAN|nr:hypothetical protein HanXRQr2_Chr12g0523271 [Helianthus annuus]KAJ0488072.1 hypothetical protein HanHA300_Chr12g0428981 [Helianthus annuus]KAJ0491431.1 hypothetical protein HanIR_Chr12g0563731 [Helianthus annuus]KAJ0503883.1 hypothetical protein HanHA89_Chr12g0453261 [Helianthus annuus]KAJ0676926.1 hypothetical protein HanOQP8_Chr12g0431361 [Helianthus annuus]
MASSKLRVNLARFASENVSLFDYSKDQKDFIPEEQHGGKQVNRQTKSQAFIKDGGGRSFRDLFVKDNGAKVEGSSNQVHDDGVAVEAFENIFAFKELVGVAAVGRCKNLSILNNLFSLLTKAGERDYSISYLGSLFVLVKFRSEEHCNSFVSNHDLWIEWFSSLDHWNGQSLPFKRIAWLRMVGVPIHLAVDEVYESIACNFRKIVHASQRSVDDLDLSVNCVGVLRGDGVRIEVVVSLKWKDKRFKIWVKEVAKEWTPEGLEGDGSGSDEEFSSENRSSEFRFDDKEDEELEEETLKADQVDKEALGAVHGSHEMHGEGVSHLEKNVGPEEQLKMGGNVTPEEILQQS